MDTYYLNKQLSYQTTVAFADKPENRPIWKDQDPKAFTFKLDKARTLVAGLMKFTGDLETDLSGVRADKETIQKALVESVVLLGDACAEWFDDHEDATNAATVDFTQSGLLNARDQVPAQAASAVVEKARAILALPAVPAPELPPSEYGITAAVVQAIEDLLGDYNLVMTSPTGARKARKGRRELVPARFAEVDRAFAGCDRLVGQLRGKETDLPAVREMKDAFVKGWFASRRVDDLGTGRSNGAPVPDVPKSMPATAPRAA